MTDERDTVGIPEMMERQYADVVPDSLISSLEGFSGWRIEKKLDVHTNGLKERYVVEADSMTGVGKTLEEALNAWEENRNTRRFRTTPTI